MVEYFLGKVAQFGWSLCCKEMLSLPLSFHHPTIQISLYWHPEEEKTEWVISVSYSLPKIY